MFINRNFIKNQREKKITQQLAKKRNEVFFFGGRRYPFVYNIYLLKILKNVYGISLKRHIKYFASFFGLGFNVSIVYIKSLIFQKLQLLLQKLLLNYELEKSISYNIGLKRRLKTYQGVRSLMHLPIRGQRTKTNAQAVKKIRKKILKKDTKRVRKRGNSAKKK